MAYYHKLGKIPPKRHTQFRQPDGSLYAEQLVGTLGFSGVASLLYHIHPPTRIGRIAEPIPYGARPLTGMPLAPGHLKTWGQQAPGGDYLAARQTLLLNQDVTISLCHPTEKDMAYFY
jgi:homogentisate 1,2-dioxygenase